MERNRAVIVTFVVAVIGFVIILAIAIAASSDDDLDGTSWVVESVEVDGEVSLPIAGTTVTATFTDGEINGSAGCNNYFGGYELEGNAMNVGPLASTQMFCEEPTGSMDQELGYLALLGGAESFAIKGDEMTIEIAGDRRINFVRA